ncbi:hypothetical protein [Micromonospora sp. DT233]|uniref:hypothetical protein n=1 Tax=Micromonospora sp. DT233 TaxID=3393432 RepID=UPI003CF030D0
MSPSRQGAWWRAALAGVVGVALPAATLWRWHDIASAEAWLNARLVSAAGLADANSIGTAVVFPLDQRWVGFTVSTGYSVVMLLILPIMLASTLVGFRRISAPRGMSAVALTAGLLIVVNQIRMVAVAVAMRIWGHQFDFESSLVLIGSIIATVGLIAMTILFMVLVGHGRRTLGTAGR